MVAFCTCENDRRVPGRRRGPGFPHPGRVAWRSSLRRIVVGIGLLAASSAGLSGRAAADDGLDESLVPTPPRAAMTDAGLPPPVVRYWPHGREIRLGYRLIGDYETLRERLRAAEPIGIGANWEPAFDAIAGVDVERHLLDRVDHFAALTGLSILPERYEPADQSARFDMCIDFYLSDRREDEISFDCLLEMQDELSSSTHTTENFTAWGFVVTYGTETAIQGAACLALYSALTFRSEMASDYSRADLSVAPGTVRRIRPPPFSPLFGNSPVGPIMGYPHGFFGGIRRLTDRTGEPQDDTLACRHRLRETYHRQVNRIVDNCIISALGLPISDASPAAVIERSDVSPYSTITHLPEWPAGSVRWVSAIGYQTAYRHQETPRLRLLERQADDLLQTLYGGDMALATLQGFAGELEARAGMAVDADAAPPRRNLYRAIEEDCLGLQ